MSATTAQAWSTVLPASDAVLQVEDTGVGVSTPELPRLFERFYRVEGAAGRTQEGSGIGLALVQELVKLHGGTIGATSQPGIGTSFRVTVPLGTAHLPSERIEVPRSLSSTAVTAQAFVQEALRWIPTNLSGASSAMTTLVEGSTKESGPGLAKRIGARILLADDNADMRRYVHDLLAPTYSVETVADGQHALEAARHQRPDLILCDIMMPRMDGLELLKALRADELLRDIPVILLSARAGEESRVEGLASGADDYLVKPFSARELTARMSALLELTRMRRENEERFRAFISATSDVIYKMSADWSVMRSLQGRNFIADTADSSRTWLDRYIPSEDQPHVTAAIHEAIRNKGVFALEHRVRRVDGTLGWAFSRAVPLTDADGNIVEWFGAACDVTERKRAEKRLREREEALRQAHAALQARTSDLARFNQAAVRRELRMIELKEEVNRMGQQLGECCRYPLEADEEPDPRAPMACSEGDGLAPLESIQRTAQLHAALNLLEDAVQAQRLAEDSNRKLRESQEALREADRRKTEFLALLGHELRNPLSPISAASEVLSRTLTDQEHARAAINIIKRQAAQLTRLVDDLLDVARITQGRIDLQRKPLELAAVIAQAVETVEPQLRQRQHEISVVARDERLYVDGDFARLVQCVVNLLTNAAKYTEPHGRIRVETRAEASSVVIEVSDTGTGVSPELLPGIFDLFVQGDRTLDRAEGGLGVGLSVVKRLIEMHEGSVGVSSAGLGHGATFEIRLPRIAAPARAGEDAQGVESSPRRILIVDDNPDAANCLAMLLGLAGHETEVAHGALEALERVESFQPEMALLDIGLPGMNGYELARRLRIDAKLAGIRLVALTGYGQAEDQQRALAAGFDDHLVKPVDLAELERSLNVTARRL